jgi:hypothetical protein
VHAPEGNDAPGLLRGVVSGDRLSLCLVSLLVVPVAAALAAVLPGVPGYVPPLVLVASGVAYGWLAVRTLFRELVKRSTLDEPESSSSATEQTLGDEPLWMPFALFGSGVFLLAGVLWLAFVDWRLASVTAALVVARVLWPYRPRAGRHPEPGSG